MSGRPRQITVTEAKVLHEGQVYLQGVQTVSEDVAIYFCSMGWATCADEDIPSATRRPGHIVLNPQKGASSLDEQGRVWNRQGHLGDGVKKAVAEAFDEQLRTEISDQRSNAGKRKLRVQPEHDEIVASWWNRSQLPERNRVSALIEAIDRGELDSESHRRTGQDFPRVARNAIVRALGRNGIKW